MTPALNSMTVPDPLSVFELSGELEKKLRVLGRIEELVLGVDHAALRRLEGLMHGADGVIRQAMERALVRLRRSFHDASPAPDRTPLSIVRVLREGSTLVRLALIRKMEGLERFSCAPTLAAQLMVEDEPRVASALARALGRLGGPEFLPTLRIAARHPHASVRAGVAEGLAYQRGNPRDELLLELLADEDETVRSAADGLLEEIRRGFSGSDSD